MATLRLVHRKNGGTLLLCGWAGWDLISTGGEGEGGGERKNIFPFYEYSNIISDANSKSNKMA